MKKVPQLLKQWKQTGYALSTASEAAFSGRVKAKERHQAIKYGLVALTSGLLGWAAYSYKKQKLFTQCKEASMMMPGLKKHGLPEYSQEEVAKHNNPGGRIWVTYGHGVYDITDFMDKHPGGKDKIILASGGSLEPFWALYDMHKSQHVYEWLESYRIGNFRDAGSVKKRDRDVKDPFINDPDRHPALRINSKKPFNAEPPPQIIVDSFITPNELFYVRNHHPVPEIEPKQYKLQIEGMGVKTVQLSLDDLKTKFKKGSVVATLQCGGNRRSDMSQSRPVRGLSWGSLAVGNAEWTGVWLKDVLKHAGLNEDNTQVKHIQFEGLDKEPTGQSFGASIPVHKAWENALLAYEMNGQPLPRDHGYPVRLVVPGVIGVRNVKWLGKISPSHEESDSHAQRGDYMTFNPSIDWGNVDFTKGVAIQDVPVTSAILEPLPGTKVEAQDEEITIRGYAWSGGGRGIIRVDVSSDGGKTWHDAELTRPSQPMHQTYAWTLWEATIPIPQNANEVQLICKAVDNSYNVQPDSTHGIWNMRGLLNNSWHNVKLPVEPQ